MINTPREDEMKNTHNLKINCFSLPYNVDVDAFVYNVQLRIKIDFAFIHLKTYLLHYFGCFSVLLHYLCKMIFMDFIYVYYT